MQKKEISKLLTSKKEMLDKYLKDLQEHRNKKAEKKA